MFQELGSTDFWNDGNSNVFRVGLGTSLVVQALRLCTPNAGGSGPIPGQVTGSHTPQLEDGVQAPALPAVANGNQRDISRWIFLLFTIP